MMESKTENLYIKKGQVANAAVGSIITLVVGVGVVTLVIIFVGVLGGQTFQLAQPNLQNITNQAVGTAVNTSILSGFTTLQTTTSYVPLIVLAVIIFIVLTLVLGFTSFSGQSQGGSAL